MELVRVVATLTVYISLHVVVGVSFFLAAIKLSYWEIAAFSASVASFTRRHGVHGTLLRVGVCLCTYRWVALDLGQVTTRVQTFQGVRGGGSQR